MSDIPGGRFRNLSIGILNLEYQRISSIDEVFMDIVALNVFDASHNNVSWIEPDAFKPVARSLTELRLKDNRLDLMRPVSKLQMALNYLASLKRLDLSNNRLEVLPDLTGLVSLQEVNLVGNRLRPANVEGRLPSWFISFGLEITSETTNETTSETTSEITSETTSETKQATDTDKQTFRVILVCLALIGIPIFILIFLNLFKKFFFKRTAAAAEAHFGIRLDLPPEQPEEMDQMDNYIDVEFDNFVGQRTAQTKF